MTYPYHNIKKIKVQILRLSNAKDLPLPKYMTSYASGADIFAAIKEELTIEPGEIKLIPTGFCVAIPKGYEIQIRPRSGLAIKHGITIVNAPGTIDADYRGEIKVGLINLGSKSFTIKRGDRIAQMVLSPCPRIYWEEVIKLPETQRAEGGFGHTG